MACCTNKNLPNVPEAALPSPSGEPVGYVLTIDSLGEPAWEAATGGSGSVTSITAGSGITCTPNPITTTGTISLSNTAVTPATYGSGSQIPIITVDQKGRITAASNTSPFITINTTSPLQGGLPVGLGGTITLNHATSGVVAGSYGDASTGSIPAVTVNATGHITSVTASTLTSKAVSGSTYITLSGDTSFYSPSGTGMVITSIALDSIPTRNWSAGTGAVITGGQADSVAIGNNALASGNTVSIGSATGNSSMIASVALGTGAATTVTQNSVVVGFQAGDSAAGTVTIIGYRAGRGVGVANGVIIGAQAGASVTGGSNTIIGSGAGFGLTTGFSNVLIGNDCTAAAVGTTGGTAVGVSTTIGGSESSIYGFNGSCTGTSATAIGARADASGSASTCLGHTAIASSLNSTAIGKSATASASNAMALGANVTNSTANSCLIGNSGAYIVKSEGFFQASSWYSCKAGRSSGTQVVTFPGPVTLTINNTVWTSGCAVSGNNITMPQRLTQFSINSCVLVNAIGSPATGVIVLRIRYFDGTTTSTLSSSTLAVTSTTPAGTSWCCSGTVQTPANTTSYVFCELERLSGTTVSVDITQWALTVKRDA